MTAKSGCSMQLDVSRVHIKRANRGGQAKLWHGDIPKLRAMLRTEMAVADIAEQLNISVPALRNFIKKRQICDLNERGKWIKLQKSINK